MTIDQLSKILFVQALEEADPKGHHLPFSTRHHATQQARDKPSSPSGTESESPIPFFLNRAETIWAFMGRSLPPVTKFQEQMKIDVPLIWMAVPAFIAGLLINGLGESQRINLLNFPLLLLFIWNVSIYLGTAVLRGLKSPPTQTWLEFPAFRLSKIIGVGGKRSWQNLNISDPSSVQWVKEATSRYMMLMWAQAGPLWIQHLRQRLHLGAAFVAIGILFGLYIRGLVLDYQATWESTFLSASHVQPILHILLGPAAWLLQDKFPTVNEIMALQAPRHGPAAPWIHMWAITTLAVVVLPRCLLAWTARRSIAKARQNLSLPLQTPYFVHLLAPNRGQNLQVTILPYSYRPPPRTKDFLEKSLLDLYGNLATLHWEDPLPFGDSFQVSPDPAAVHILVLLFHAGQTPEMDVHGELIHAVQTGQTPATRKVQLLVLLDLEPYRQSVEENRVIERRQAWQRLANQYHLHLVPFDAQLTSPDQLFQQAQAGMKAPPG